MTKLALPGIDSYENLNRLSGCEADATMLSALLSHNEDGAPNFECRTLLSSTQRLSRAELRSQIESFFQRDTHVLVFFFADHGYKTIAQSMIASLANNSQARERI
jgi:hypothetical protein